MVESFVTLRRKDYLALCKLAGDIEYDLDKLVNEDTKDLVGVVRNKIMRMQNLLIEDEE